MRESLTHLSKYRFEESPEYVDYMKRTTDYIGSFLVDMPRITKDKFKVIASIDKGEWEYISISVYTANREPTFEETEYIRLLFFEKEESEGTFVERNPICIHFYRNIFEPGKSPW